LFRRQSAVPQYAPSPQGGAPPPEVRAAPLREIAPARLPVVEVRDVSMAFGGVRAINGVSLSVAPGTVHALIGPNGAGKTVLLNILCGYYPPTAGQVLINGRPVTGLPSHQRARRGVARTFQTTQLFGELTVLQNVLAGFPGQTHGRLLDSLIGTPRLRREEAVRCEAACALLRFVGYAGDPDARAGSLPFGHQRLVEIARALALEPLVLAMDEPAAGLNPSEVDALDELITRIRVRGIAVLLIEHHMDLVMGISDQITVLQHGEKLAEGVPEAVQGDPAVIKAYLGDREAEAPRAAAAL
jgi:branched-chain amino acid transport system permease protein